MHGALISFVTILHKSEIVLLFANVRQCTPQGVHDLFVGFGFKATWHHWTLAWIESENAPLVLLVSQLKKIVLLAAADVTAIWGETVVK